VVNGITIPEWDYFFLIRQRKKARANIFLLAVMRGPDPRI
jgi:hypothetical protein